MRETCRMRPLRRRAVVASLNVPSAAGATVRVAFATPQPAATFTVTRARPSSRVRMPIRVSCPLARATFSGAVPPP